MVASIHPQEEAEVSRTIGIVKKSVSFNDDVDVRETLNKKDLTRSERQGYWLSRWEMSRMRRREQEKMIIASSVRRRSSLKKKNGVVTTAASKPSSSSSGGWIVPSEQQRGSNRGNIARKTTKGGVSTKARREQQPSSLGATAVPTTATPAKTTERARSVRRIARYML